MQNIFMNDINKKLSIFREHCQRLKRQFETISALRLIVFLVAMIGLLIGIISHCLWGWILLLAGGIVFVVLMKKHTDIENHKQYLERLIDVMERYQKRQQGEWKSFQEDGGRYLDESDCVSVDLDVFGEASLYQMICTAHTYRGKQRLADVLTGMNGDMTPSLQELKKRQEAVAELTQKPDFVLHFEALGMQCEKEEKRKNIAKREEEKQCAETSAPASIGITILSWLFPILFGVTAVGSLVHWWNGGATLVMFFCGLLLSFILSGYCHKRMGRVFEQSDALQSYLYMIDALATQQFQCTRLKELQAIIIGTESGAENLLKGLRTLERLLVVYNLRFHPILHWILGGVFLYDVHLANEIARWEQTYSSRMEAGIKAIAEVEMLSSLSVLNHIRETSYPELIETQQPEIAMKRVCHPLLLAERAVANDIALQRQTVVITGSNMSGKTTFLRTIGLNLVLAYAGGPVCATKVVVSKMKIFTSMRIRDDVQHGISTFYAEILRIKQMVEYGELQLPMLCLIDEIFKGTNSADRIVGAEAVLQRLTTPQAITVVSTHDFELCQFADNYHFEEYYEENEIRFDYRLREGKCTTTNALYLLKMAGLRKD